MPEQHTLFGDRFTVRCAVALADPPTGSEPQPRTITATLAEYGKTVHPVSYFPAVRLAAGALDLPDDLADVKLLRDHDSARVIGVLDQAAEMAKAPTARFRFGRTQDAEEAYSLIEDGILTHVSVGYEILDGRQVVEDGTDVFEVTAARLFEVSLVGRPADTAARISSYAQEGPAMPNAPETPPAAPPALPGVDEYANELTSRVLDQVRAELAPAAAAPLAPPQIGEARQGAPVTRDGTPIVVRAADRTDPRIPAALGRDGRRYTAGDYFAAYARGKEEGDWTREREIRQALADETTTEVPGLLPHAIVGELLGRATDQRRIWDSLGRRDMPMLGEKFSRPRITQHVDVDKQAAQKTQVATRKYLVELDDVSKSTLGGGLDLSQQAIDWTSPSLLNELIIDFTRRYLARTDQLAATSIAAAQAAGKVSVEWDGTAAKLTTALAQASGKVAEGVDPEMTDARITTAWVATDVWVQLAGLTDTTGRPLLPNLGPMNATGTMDVFDPQSGVGGTGVRWVVSRRFPAGTFIVGDATYTEAYENGRRFLSALRPDVLGMDIAYMGYTATFFPYPKVLVAIKAPTPPEGGGAAAKG